MRQSGAVSSAVVGAVGAARVVPLGWPETARKTEFASIGLSMDGFAELESSGPLKDQVETTLGQRIIESYKSVGLGFLGRMRGSFRLALWDSNFQRLVLAVDPFATRPLYYWLDREGILYAPRMSAFSDVTGLVREIDPNAIYFYLNHSFIPGPYTIFCGIKRLEPGECLVWENGVHSVRRYWDMTYPEEVEGTEEDICAKIRAAMEDSVKFHLRDLEQESVPFGAFLSGGVDSSTLLGLMGRATGQQVKSYSVGFNEEVYNEIYYARIAAACFRAEAHEYFVQPAEALDALMRLGQEFDEPFGNSSAIPTYFCLKMARDSGVKVMFAGDGGDELFGGNERYATERTFTLYHDFPSWLRRPIDGIAPMLPGSFPWRKVRNYVQKANQPVADRFFAYQLYMRDHAQEYFTDDFRTSIRMDFPLAVPREHYRRSGNASALNRLLYMDLKLAIADNDLFKVNRMAESLDMHVRYPYLDKQVGIMSGKIPAHLKVKGWKKRYIFKKAYENFLPQEILTKTKHGFGLPTGDWLRSDVRFRDLARSLLLDARSLSRGYFKRRAMEDLLALHDGETSSYYGSHIWNFMMLELWHRFHVDRVSVK